MYHLATIFPAIRKVKIPFSRDQLFLLMAAINEIFLGIDIYLAHMVSGTIVPNEWIPIIFGPSAGVLLLLAGLLAIKRRGIATIIAAVIAWTQGSNYLDISNLSAAILVVIIFQIIQLFEGLWLTPRVMGKRMKFHPGVVLIIVVGTLISMGTLMTIIIIPLLSTLIIIFRYLLNKRTGAEHWPDRVGQSSEGET